MTAEADSPWAPYLRPGERVLWHGSPVPGFHQRKLTVFLMLFGLPFLVIGLAVFFSGLYRMTLAPDLSEAGLAIFFAAFGVPFAALGAFFTIGPVVRARNRARHMRYALTDRAAYIVTTGQFPSVKVYPILPATALELEPGDRATTVWLHARQERDSDGDLGTTKSGFENIAEGHTVYHLIRDVQCKDA